MPENPTLAAHNEARTDGKVILYEPPKETVRTLELSEIADHVRVAREIVRLCISPEIDFIQAYAYALESQLQTSPAPPYVAPPGQNPKIAAAGVEAANARLTITGAVRKMEKWLAAHHRGSFRSEAKTTALRKTALLHRVHPGPKREVRQPLIVSPAEFEIVEQAAALAQVDLTDFIRDSALDVCAGKVPFVAPPIHQVGGRDKQYQIRWFAAEWQSVQEKSAEVYRDSGTKRSTAGILVRDVVLQKSRELIAAAEGK